MEKIRLVYSEKIGFVVWEVSVLFTLYSMFCSPKFRGKDCRHQYAKNLAPWEISSRKPAASFRENQFEFSRQIKRICKSQKSQLKNWNSKFSNRATVCKLQPG